MCDNFYPTRRVYILSSMAGGKCAGSNVVGLSSVALRNAQLPRAFAFGKRSKLQFSF